MDLFGLLMGGMAPSNNYKEIIKLHEMLENEKIPHTFKPWMGGYIIRYFGHKELPNDNNYGYQEGVVCSIIEHNISYGHEEDLLEIEGLTKKGDRMSSGVAGYLTAKEVFNRIKENYENN